MPNRKFTLTALASSLLVGTLVLAGCATTTTTTSETTADLTGLATTATADEVLG